MKQVNDIFLDMLPKIDLHGYDAMSTGVAVNDFILENYLLNQTKVVIIHGIGKGIVKKAVHEQLKKNDYVLSYKIDNFNVGCTVVEIKSKSN